MKRNFLILPVLLSLILLPAGAMAASHEHGAAPGGHAEAGHAMPMGHEMAEQSQMISLGDQVVDGVKAEAQLNDIQATMAQMGMKETHHLMVMIQHTDGKTLESGTVALKVKGPDGVESAAIPLTGMGGHFGADIVLGAPGPYTFTVGTRLTDGKTRQFLFSHELK